MHSAPSNGWCDQSLPTQAEWLMNGLCRRRSALQSPTHGVRLSKNASVIYEIARLSVSSQTFSIARRNGRFENFSGQVDIDHGVTPADHTATSAVTANFHNLDAGRSRCR